MSLSFDDRLKLLMPSWFYYTQKIARESRKKEPELRILRELVPPGCTAIDVGANRGYYSYALSKIAGRVEAFEPNPDLAGFARRMLGAKAALHEVALSNHNGSAILFIPQIGNGLDVHFNSSLKKIYPFSKYVEVPVKIATLDQFGFGNVGFIKIDAEGSDLDVVAGARETIARHRPNMVIELVAPTHADPVAAVEHVEQTYRYAARVMVGGRLVPAREALRKSWQEHDTCNVVFIPK